MRPLGSMSTRMSLVRQALQSPELRDAIKAQQESEVHRLVAEKLGLSEGELPKEAIRVALGAATRKLKPDDDTVPDYSKEGRRLERFSAALAGALGAGQWSSASPAQRGSWFAGASEDIKLDEVLLYLSGALPADLAPGPNDEQLRKAGYEPLLSSLKYDPSVRYALSEKGAHALAYRAREVNAALFGGATFALAKGLHELLDRPLPELPRVGKEPELTSLAMFSTPPPSLVSAGLERVPSAVVGEPSSGLFWGPNGAFFQSRAAIGEFGAPLAYAIVEANRIAFSLVDGVAGALSSEAHKAVMGRLTVQKEAVPLLQEGIASIGHVLGLLLAKKPEGMELDQALAMIAEHGLVHQVALHAPFGQIGPMHGQGLVPKEPIAFNERGQLLIPRSLHEVLRTAQQAAVLPSMEHPLAPEFPTQTTMGCPVASRMPKAEGTQRTSPLSALVTEYIELIRKILREMPAEQLANPKNPRG